ncbi:hypothetical protein SKAU_G00178200 [Synaphobranchus kaupii]|uniref:Homeobox domain-containing protein n=1 Tax=Synaphobranchus kaupii TaxID=118154 RepID=A0A9Q1FMB5_SYNKA|nr:hypothetical protein SKAU_G00178200 [Synaphobranchus kaupii]
MSSRPTPRSNPIKINLKMLKVTKPEPESGVQSERETDSPKSPPPFTSGRGKKTAEQLHLLRQVFASTHWPSSLQYDQLIARTGLPRPEVVRWFGDSRYVYKNGQLKWLESYQHATAAEEKGEEKKDEGEEEEEEEEEEGEEGEGDTTVLKDQGKLDKEEAPVAGQAEDSAEGQGQRLPQAPESRRAEEEVVEEEEEQDQGAVKKEAEQDQGAVKKEAEQDQGAVKKEAEQDQGAVKKEAEQNRSSPACGQVEGEGGTAPVTTVQFSKPSPGGSSQDGSLGL